MDSDVCVLGHELCLCPKTWTCVELPYGLHRFILCKNSFSSVGEQEFNWIFVWNLTLNLGSKMVCHGKCTQRLTLVTLSYSELMAYVTRPHE
jgi:hypothetical protein